MYVLHAPALQHFLSALIAREDGATGANASSGAGESIAAAMGTMHIYYPVFDEHLQGALELRVNFIPTTAAASCASRSQALGDPGGPDPSISSQAGCLQLSKLFCRFRIWKPCSTVSPGLRAQWPRADARVLSRVIQPCRRTRLALVSASA